MIRYIIFLFLIVGCNTNSQLYDIKLVSDSIKQKYAPDSRVALYDVKITSLNQFIIIKGETNILSAKKEIIYHLESIKVEYYDSLDLLPNYKYKNGIVNNSVGNLRGKPSHSSELVSQAVLGTKLKILKRTGEWYMVQTPDNYISWIDHGGIKVMSDKNFDNYYLNNYVFSDVYGFSYETINKEKIVSDLVLGSVLNVIDTESNYYKIRYPDGRIGLVDMNSVISISSLRDNKKSESNLLEYALGLRGIPYLWGGTSTKGFDCSGFTKTVYMMNGLNIPRDASQQINEGKLIDKERKWSKLTVGDLMFFGYYKNGRRRIDHVAMWIGDGKFIQASKNVRINSVHSSSPIYDKYHMEKYIESRRIIGNETFGVKKL